MIGCGWPADLADELVAALASLEAGLRAEQAPHGLDSWGELPLAAAIAAALARRHAVAREVHYPSTAGRKRTHRPRCDLVLRPLDDAAPSASSAPSSPPPTAASPAPTADALWLELKVARQHRALGCPDPRYGAQWRRHLAADLAKLAAEPGIATAGLVLVAFTADAVTWARDLDDFERVMVRQGVVAGFRQTREVAIIDRMGHSRCGVAVWPTVQQT